MKIDKEKLYSDYMAEVRRICDLEENEFKTSFEPRKIVDIICGIMNGYPQKVYGMYFSYRGEPWELIGLYREEENARGVMESYKSKNSVLKYMIKEEEVI